MPPPPSPPRLRDCRLVETTPSKHRSPERAIRRKSSLDREHLTKDAQTTTYYMKESGFLNPYSIYRIKYPYIKKWQARRQEDKKIVAETKQKIQNKFKEEMGLLVDIPKPGFGNTNDGSTSRRFFSDPQTSSRIIGLDIGLIEKCPDEEQAIKTIKLKRGREKPRKVIIGPRGRPRKEYQVAGEIINDN
ncbi:unnamed protein product [Brassicogethes aeneus]|uniref:Uncharacterized protein n=1 Tax=Brassicogethes aeneus TaxID=1431903 RepID=A0A9P0BBZ4_BRAAE|nr:unnamed protein product [Brassicogethes aeneus]